MIRLEAPVRLPHTWPRMGDVPIDRYALTVDGVVVGSIALAQHNGWAWVGSVDVAREHRRRGYGVMLHELAQRAIGGPLVVEQVCSPDEKRVIDSLRRRGWVVKEIPGLTYAGRGVWGIRPPREDEIHAKDGG